MNGGSNYTCITGTLSDSPIFGVFNEGSNPDTVKSQMQAMFAGGQNMITFVIWFSDINQFSTPPYPDRWGHMLNSHSGALSPQHQQNVVDVMKLAEQIGFSEIHFRFAGESNSNVGTWQAWNQTQFDLNSTFVLNTRNLVRSGVTKANLLFDLALETVATNPLNIQYCVEMWRKYVAANPPTDATCGMGAGRNPTISNQRAKLLPSQLRAAGLPLPSFYLCDIYGNETAILKSIHDGMMSAGQGNLPVYVQECFYNDAASAAAIQRAIRTVKRLKVRGVFQWPWIRGSGPANVNFGPVFPKDFNNYLK